METIIQPQVPCTLEDLRAIVPRWDSWSVDKDGNTVDFTSDGALDHDALDIDEYQCLECGEYFTPTAKYELNALADAWQRALDHLPSVKTSDGRIVRVEVAS